MFPEKFILTFSLALFLLVSSFVVFLLLSQGNWQLWLSLVWLRALAICIGIDFGLVLYIGWDYINPTETRLPLYLALAASMLIALLYKGITLLIGLF